MVSHELYIFPLAATLFCFFSSIFYSYLKSQIINKTSQTLNVAAHSVVTAVISIVIYSIQYTPSLEARVQSFPEEALLTETHWRTDGVPTGSASQWGNKKNLKHYEVLPHILYNKSSLCLRASLPSSMYGSAGKDMYVKRVQQLAIILFFKLQEQSCKGTGAEDKIQCRVTSHVDMTFVMAWVLNPSQRNAVPS